MTIIAIAAILLFAFWMHRTGIGLLILHMTPTWVLRDIVADSTDDPTTVAICRLELERRYRRGLK